MLFNNCAVLTYVKIDTNLLGLQKDIGSIEVGKRADFTVLGLDSISISAISIKDIPVKATIQDGRVYVIQ